MGKQFCVCCRVRDYLAGFSSGTRLFDITGQAFLKSVRAQLQLVGFSRAADVTLRSFRSGMATQLARDGKCIEAILAAGEWRGAAVMSYMKTQNIDVAELLKAAFEASDDEFNPDA